MPLDHTAAADSAVVNPFFKERNEYLITYRSGGRTTQIDFILVRRKKLKNVIDAKVIPPDSTAPQYHCLLVTGMRLQHRRPKRPQISSEGIKCWELAEYKTALEILVKTAIRTANIGDVSTKWSLLERAITEGACELVGTTKPERSFIDMQTRWWFEKVEVLVKKKNAYKKWARQRSEDNM